MWKINPLIEDLNEEQQKAVDSDGVSLVFAGAGSGKTRTLIYKLAQVLFNGFSADKVLALTFTNKAAQEMKERTLQIIRKLFQKNINTEYKIPFKETFVGTFHSFGARFLRQEVSKTLTIYDEEDSNKLIKEILSKTDEDLDINYVKEMISFAKNRLINNDEFLNSENPNERKIAEIWQIYDNKLKERNAFDFDDLILHPLKMLLENENLKEKYQYQYLLVDEFQDTNLPQYLLVKILIEKHKNLFIVGDDYQSIYGFRGTNYRNILEIHKDFPGVKTFILGRNYRSTKKIVASANQLILNNKQQKHKKLWTNNKNGENLNVYETYNEDEEAEIVSDIISGLLQSHMPSEIAILYRVNFLSRALEEKFLLKKIPYKIFGGVHFYQRKEIKDILAYLKILNNPKDIVSLKRIINTPPRQIGAKTQEKIFNLDVNAIEKLLQTCAETDIESRKYEYKEFKKFIKIYSELSKLKNESPPITEFLKNLIDITGYLEYIKEDFERIHNISELINVSSRFNDMTFEQAFEEFLNLASLWQQNDEINKEDKIKLMTIHLAKGLEFKNVFIVGVEEGIFPHYKSMNDDLFSDSGNLEEERRLAYVAITRAKENVYISYTKRRRQWGKFTDTLPSRFISELPADYVNFYGLEI